MESDFLYLALVFKINDILSELLLQLNLFIFNALPAWPYPSEGWPRNSHCSPPLMKKVSNPDEKSGLRA